MGHWSEVLSVQKTRKMLTFLDADDEAALWAILKGLLPDLLLVDGDRWPTPNPPLAAAPSGCSDSRMFLWSPDVAETLPSRLRHDHYDGPASGLVIEWSRSNARDGELRSGRIAVGFDTDHEPMVKLVNLVFREAKKFATNPLYSMTGIKEPWYWIGESALKRARKGLRLRDRSVPNYLKLPEDRTAA